MAVGS